ncbi:MAG: hypothetical protein AAF849_00660 [Bacteroidota bacterium]
MSTESQYYNYNPEKRNIFIEINQGRRNTAREFIIGFFMLFASHGSAIVEVFMRRKFGERYITLAQSIGIFFVVSIFFPLIYSWFVLAIGEIARQLGERSFPERPSGISFLLLFIFMLAFLVMSIYHRLEIKRYGTTYDFKRFSLSDGEIHPLWWNLIGKEIFGFKISHYTVRVLLEPLVPIALGFLLSFIPGINLVGTLLLICGISFMARNFNKAQMGRDWVLDNIDKKISNDMKYDVFIGRKSKKDTKGIYLPIELPESEETRKSLYNIVEDTFTTDNEIWVNDFLDEKESNIQSSNG